MALFSRLNFRARVMAILFGLFFMVFYQQVVTFAYEQNLPSALLRVVQIAAALLPLAWIVLWNRTLWCIYLVTVVFVMGDYAPALASPVAFVLTLPNFTYALYKHHNARVIKFILPLMLLSGIYMAAAVALGFITMPVQVSRTFMFDLGWLGVFLGPLIVYHIIYIPLAMYDLVTSKDGQMIKHVVIFMSLLVNVVVVYGLFEFLSFMLQVDFFGALALTDVSPDVLEEVRGIRISSLIRKSTRLGPFIVISLPIFFVGLFQTRRWLFKSYWLLSLLLSAFILLLTYSRAALVAAGLLWAMLFLTFLSSRQYRAILIMLLSSAAVGILILLANSTFELYFFRRFTESSIESGLLDRQVRWSLFFEGIDYFSYTELKAFLHLLFGYGVFSERTVLGQDPHNTFVSAFACFGALGSLLYFLPYVWVTILTAVRSFSGTRLMRPYYGMCFVIFLLFLGAGAVHNKLYSPIESAYTWLIMGVLLYPELPEFFGPSPARLDKRLT